MQEILTVEPNAAGSIARTDGQIPARYFPAMAVNGRVGESPTSPYDAPNKPRRLTISSRNDSGSSTSASDPY